MKTYSKIVGVILTLAGIGAFLGVIAGIINSNDIEDKVGISLLFVPCIIFLHYMYIHNFGFNLNSEIPVKNYRIILILTILSIVISAIIPSGYLLNQIHIQENAKEMIDRGTDNSSSGDLNATLKTKYEDGQLKYIFSVLHPNKSELDWDYYDKFSFELRDKDGFIITTVEATNYVNIVENKKIYGINSNSNQYLTFSDYLKIKSWQLVYTTKY
jgi:hypothetical protein